jgi:hypothetical protein
VAAVAVASPSCSAAVRAAATTPPELCHLSLLTPYGCVVASGGARLLGLFGLNLRTPFPAAAAAIACSATDSRENFSSKRDSIEPSSAVNCFACDKIVHTVGQPWCTAHPSTGRSTRAQQLWQAGRQHVLKSTDAMANNREPKSINSPPIPPSA